VNTALKSLRTGLLVVSLTLALAGSIRADTIYLKNGRKIQGTNVVRRDGKVTFETAAGTMSVPESSVDHIVSGETPIGPQWNQTSATQSEVSLAPPSSTVPAPALQSILRNGAIDQQALAQIDARAATRDPEALAHAAQAEAAASHFELDGNNLGAVLQHTERALSFAPGDETLLLDVAYLHLKRGEYQPALDSLEKARRIDPNSSDIAKLTGWADFGLNRLSDAVAEWTRSQQHPDAEVARALQKAKRDLDVDNAFREGRSAHFDLHYYGEAAPQLAREVLRSLEADFEEISGALNYTPKEPISVTLYTNQQFQDITRAPSWAGALNDGRIRVPVQGLDGVTPPLARVLKHELTHSFINEKTHGRCPTWLNEGTAQWMEGSRTGTIDASELLRMYDHHNDPSLAALEPFWTNLQTGFAHIAYAWSLAVVETIETSSPGDLERILDRLDGGASGEEAVRGTLHVSYADLNTATADYLRKIR